MAFENLTWPAQAIWNANLGRCLSPSLNYLSLGHLESISSGFLAPQMSAPCPLPHSGAVPTSVSSVAHYPVHSCTCCRRLQYPEGDLHLQSAVGTWITELESLVHGHVIAGKQLTERDLQMAQRTLMLFIFHLRDTQQNTLSSEGKDKPYKCPKSSL